MGCQEAKLFNICLVGFPLVGLKQGILFQPMSYRHSGLGMAEPGKCMELRSH